MPDLIILSDDKSAVEESEIGCSDFDVDSKANSHSDRSATSYQDDDNSPNGVIEQTLLRLSPERSTTLSLDPEPETHRVSKLPVNTSSIQQSMVSVGLDVVREMEDECCDAFAAGNSKGDNGTSTKTANLQAPFDKHQASGNNVPEL